MDNRGSVCNHASLADINPALMDGLPLGSLTARYHLSAPALSRHLEHRRQALAACDRHEHQAHQAGLRPPSRGANASTPVSGGYPAGYPRNPGAPSRVHPGIPPALSHPYPV